MGLVPAKCTQCGAQVEVDNANEAAVCKYCGSAFIIEKAINQYTAYVTNNNNLAGATINVVGGDYFKYQQLAIEALQGGNHKECYDYSTRALEINPEASDAWKLKMMSIGGLETLGNLRTSEIIMCGNNAIKYADPDRLETIKYEIYDYYVLRATTMLDSGVELLDNYERINKCKQANMSYDQIANLDSATVNMSDNLLFGAAKLRLQIPLECVKARYMKQAIDIFLKFDVGCAGLNKRLRQYGRSFVDSAIDLQKTTSNKLAEGLPAQTVQQVNEISNKVNNSGGCYVATCVYGSYDCPEVWTLRRFRDDVLKQSCLGRLFVKCYYAVSPVLVERFGKYQLFKAFWKKPLDKLVEHLMNSGVSNERYTDVN